MSNNVSFPKFYHFSQNNPGGRFHFNEQSGITHHVVIQALNGADANNRASAIGIYFNGIAQGIDCECCGDRWYPTSDDDGTISAEIYGEPAEICTTTNTWMPPGKEIVIHYIDGSKAWHGVFTRS